jgi:hypothetical protein
MRRRRFEDALCGVLVACSSGCSDEDAHPPPAPTGNFCEDWNCAKGPSPIAAVAIEHGAPTDGGACDVWRFSMPPGDDAFSSIRSCGGNQIRCGSSDYRVGATDLGTTLTCTVATSGRIRLRGHVSQTNGPRFGVDGEIDSKGGDVTISAGAARDGSAIELGPISCRTDVRFVASGTIWANFDCAPDSDAATCTAHGTFVFEGCTRDTDAGVR